MIGTFTFLHHKLLLMISVIITWFYSVIENITYDKLNFKIKNYICINSAQQNIINATVLCTLINEVFIFNN